MTKSIKCEFFDYYLSENPRISEFMELIGLPAPINNGDTITLEVVEMPSSIARYLQNVWDAQDDGKLFIASMSAVGVGLYSIIERDGKTIGEASFFIPMSNIACIHPYGAFD